MSDAADLLAVRRQVAKEHGLPIRALRFLDAQDVEGLHRQAGELGRLLDVQREQQQVEDAPADLLAQAAVAKAAKKQALVNALTGRAPGPTRTVDGRFASAAAAGFDGGARRQSVPVPAESHEQTLGCVLGDGSADVGRHF
jgi:hypothetical protein